jgi:uncharacterized membrane protein
MDTINENLATEPVVEDGKTLAIVAYLTLIGLVAALVMNNEKKNVFTRFHIRQSLGLMLTGLATSFISWVPFLGWFIGLVMLVVLVILWIIGIMNAVNGKEKELPILGAKYSEWFKGI